MIARMAFLILAAALALPAAAQTFPSKPVRIIVVYPTGGTSDAVTRLLAEKIAPALGQQVLVENRGGAGGAIGMDAMAKSAPDGHTLAFSAISPLTLLPHVGKVPYDPLKDVAAVASVMYSPVYLLATPAFSGRDFADLVAQAKAKPGSLRAGTSGIATLGHLMVEQLRLAGVDLTHVPYRGGGQVITDAAGGGILHFLVVLETPPAAFLGRLDGLERIAEWVKSTSAEEPVAQESVRRLTWQAVASPTY